MISLTNTLKTFLHSIFKNRAFLNENNNILEISESTDLNIFKIIIYLPTPPSSYYQLSQWMEPLKELNKTYKVAIVTRKINTFTKVSEQNSLPVIYIMKFNGLRAFYEKCKPALVLYVNNSLKNNRSLLYKKGYHVHLNHGESEKECMSSNQSKAYDFVFTAGQRGIDRYEENLLSFDKEKYIKIGRPQLDYINTVVINENDMKKKILYAPTWEAHYAEMDYCSLEKYGLKIVKSILANPEFILVYKPHPLIGSKRESIKKINKKIINMITHSNHAFNFTGQNINDIFNSIDFALFDNSSVMIDYLFFDKPGAYIEIRKDIHAENLLQAYYSFENKHTGINTSAFINKCLSSDIKKKQRRNIKEYYLGQHRKGESTKLFISTIARLIELRSNEVDKKIYSVCR